MYKINFYLIILVILNLSCKSTGSSFEVDIPVANAWTGACPKFGFLELNELPNRGSNSPIYFSKINKREMIVLVDWKKEVRHVTLDDLTNASGIPIVESHNKFLTLFHSICGDVVSPLGKTKFQIEFERQNIEAKFDNYFKDYFANKKIDENKIKDFAYESLTSWKKDDPFLLTYFNGNDFPDFENSIVAMAPLDYRNLEREFATEKNRKFIDVAGYIDLKEFTYDSKRRRLYTDLDLRIGNNPLLGFSGDWRKFSLAYPIEVKISNEELNSFLNRKRVYFRSVFSFDVVHGQTDKIDCYNIGAQYKYIYYDKSTTPGKDEFDTCNNTGIIKYKGLKLKEEFTLFLADDKIYSSLKTKI